MRTDIDRALPQLIGLEYGTCVARGVTTEMEKIEALGKIP